MRSEPHRPWIPASTPGRSPASSRPSTAQSVRKIPVSSRPSTPRAASALGTPRSGFSSKPPAKSPASADNKTPRKGVPKDFDTTVSDLSTLRLTPKEVRLRKAAREISTRFHQNWKPSPHEPQELRDWDSRSPHNAYNHELRQRKRYQALRIIQELNSEMDPEVLDLLTGPIVGPSDPRDNVRHRQRSGANGEPSYDETQTLTWEEVKDVMRSLSEYREEDLSLLHEEQPSFADMSAEDLAAEVAGLGGWSPAKLINFESELYSWQRQKLSPATKPSPTARPIKKASPVAKPVAETGSGPPSAKRVTTGAMPQNRNARKDLKNGTLQKKASDDGLRPACVCQELFKAPDIRHEAKTLLESLSKLNKTISGRLSLVELQNIPGLGTGLHDQFENGDDGSTLNQPRPETLVTLILSEAKAALDATTSELQSLSETTTSTQSELERTRAKLYGTEQRVWDLEAQMEQSRKEFAELLEIAWNLQTRVDRLEERMPEEQEKGEPIEIESEFAKSNIRNRVNLRPLGEQLVNRPSGIRSETMAEKNITFNLKENLSSGKVPESGEPVGWKRNSDAGLRDSFVGDSSAEEDKENAGVLPI
ncbi:hypothetical protein HDU96_003192 [Phlyctochytrium bullatum]|nr:hypothetical protein HDU96_003192 [Phlyctochytrium bullatum]